MSNAIKLKIACLPISGPNRESGSEIIQWEPAQEEELEQQQWRQEEE